MDKYQILEKLYSDYDSSNNPSKKVKILNEILKIDPDDIDSMHRIISFLPKSKRLDALLRLKEDAKEIVNRLADKEDDLYANHKTRPYIFVLYEILVHYEDNNEIEKAYEIMQEISLLNEGDNLGIRFHIVAYYIGQNKLDELKRYVDTNIDVYSVASRFGKLYLDELETNHNDEFKCLFDEFPYLYSFLTKDIKIQKEELNNIVNSIEYYSPNGFYDQLMFYKLLLTFMLPSVKKSLIKLIRPNRYFYKNNIYDVLPKITKYVLYSIIQNYDNNYQYFIKKLSSYGINEDDFLKVKDELTKFQILRIDDFKNKKQVLYDEATLLMLKQFTDKDLEEIFYLKDFYCSYVEYIKRKNK